MLNLGTVRPGQTIYIPFNTFDSNDPQASATITGLAVTDIEVYKDGSPTQRASDSGYTLLDTDGIDFDTITGVHGISIDLADNTTAGFWAAGSKYFVVIASVTLDAATVNPIVATFDIGYPEAVINTTIATLSSQTSFTLTDGPAEDDALNGWWCVIHDVASKVQLGHAVISDYTGSTKTVTLAAATSFTVAATDNIAIMGPAPLQPTVTGNKLDVTATGAAGIDWGNVENQSTSVDLSATAITLCDTITTYTGNTPQTGDSFARLGAPAGASVSDDVAAVKTQTAAIELDTQDIQTQIGSAGAGLTAVPWNASWDAEVQSEVDDALVVRGLDHLVSVAVTGTDVADNSIVAKLVSSSATADWDTFVNTTDALQAIRDKQTDIETDTQDIQSRIPASLVSGRMSSDVVALSGNTTAADNLEASALGIVPGVCEGTPTTTVIQTDLAETTDDHYIGRVVVFTSGAAAGQATDITDYTGSTGTLTVTALTTAPSASDTFVIV